VFLILAGQLHRVEPWIYLRDLLCLMPGWPRSRVLELAPVFWRSSHGYCQAHRP
jgi:transposase